MFKKLFDFKGEAEAFEIIDKLLDPIANITTDKDFLAMFKKKTPKIDIAHYLVKNHAAEVTQILAILAEKDYEDFKDTITPTTVFVGIVNLLSDEELISLFR